MGFSAGGPFRDLERVLDRVTDQLEGVEPGLASRPPLDIEDADGTLVVTIDLPGFEKEDVEIQLRDDVLTIEAEHDEETKRELDEDYVRRERRHEAISRSITLPEPVDEDGATASYENGVLTVELPKSRRDAGTRVEVE